MEKVNHPAHYNIPGKKECIVQMEENYGKEVVIFFCLTNAYKYLYRAGEKAGESKDIDISKAQWYYNYAINLRKQCTIHINNYNIIMYMFDDIKKELKKYENN